MRVKDEEHLKNLASHYHSAKQIYVFRGLNHESISFAQFGGSCHCLNFGWMLTQLLIACERAVHFGGVARRHARVKCHAKVDVTVRARCNLWPLYLRYLPPIIFALKQIPSKETKIKDKRNQFYFIALKWAPVAG